MDFPPILPRPKPSHAAAAGDDGGGSFTNGTLKRHIPPPPATAAAAQYRECLKNHAAAIGGHALDGCGEFMPSPLATASDPTSLRCAACGCHRNFHRRHDDSGAGDDFATPMGTTSPTPPPPISTAHFPSAPHMLLALSTGASHSAAAATAAPAARKRFRTKFSREQKERMLLFAEKLGWRMLKQDEELVEQFCGEVGVAKGVLKVWMHNNKHTFGKKAEEGQPSLASGSSNQLDNGDVNGFDTNNHRTNGTTAHLFNGSSSSS